MKIIVNGSEKVSRSEQQAYIDYLQNKYNRKIKTLEITVDGDEVDLNYEFQYVPFDRIRRITGYLVGTMDHWNDAKRAEEADRVKHGLA